MDRTEAIKRKRCTKCQKAKPFAEFHKDSSRRDGIESSCKKCKAARMLQYYAENRGERLAYQARYYAGHRREGRIYAHTQRYGLNRLRTLGLDAHWRALRAERKFQEENPGYIQDLPQSLEDFKEMLGNLDEKS
jgi:hypothetical protein